MVIMAMGISPKMEGEQGASADSDGGGDRLSLDLPGMQEALLKAIHALGKPIVLVLFNGSPLTINWAQEHIPAIIEAWYPGQEGGNAIADVIFGDYNPSGRLPVTFVKSLDQLPDFEDYSMENRTYRFMNSTPLYPFGYGLSYTKFDYSGLALDQDAVDAGSDFAVKVSVSVTNSGDRAGRRLSCSMSKMRKLASGCPIGAAGLSEDYAPARGVTACRVHTGQEAVGLDRK